VPRIEPPSAGGKAVVRTSGEGYEITWLDRARAFVQLPAGAISFERIASTARPACAGGLPAVDWLGARLYFHVLPERGAVLITGQSVAGVRTGGRVVLFPSEGDHPRTISFDAEGSGRLRFVITGLSMGTWEVWWRGGLVDPDLPARPGGTLVFDGAPGGYFLRRR